MEGGPAPPDSDTRVSRDPEPKACRGIQGGGFY
jgi:hypothetical protein